MGSMRRRSELPDLDETPRRRRPVLLPAFVALVSVLSVASTAASLIAMH